MGTLIIESHALAFDGQISVSPAVPLSAPPDDAPVYVRGTGMSTVRYVP